MDCKLIKSGLATLGVLACVAGAQAAMDKDAIAERIAPVGDVCLASEDCGGAAAPAPSAKASGGGSDAAPDGEGIYANVCSACHDTGAAGAPVRGNEGDWAARVDKGFDTLLDHAINGFKGMPAKGGNPSLSDEDMHAAVTYMVKPVMDVAEAQGAPAEDDAADSEADMAAAQKDSAADSANAENTAAADDAGSEESGGDAQAEDAAGGGEPAWASIDGEAIFNRACMACHATGAAGAPISGNAEQWAPRIAKGKDTLYDHSINGFNAMPAKGGQPSLSDNEVKASVDYMVAESQ
ncbi:c-type cytochrome [Halomonas cibimaris]|uniref:C-type cytochrome n=1 Tax=Halomonas cibimaris TaxID=657012 RepID=A0ABP7LM99_9GAMM